MEPSPVRIEELLAHAGWVRRLAARLVRDAGTADDVAQEVWAYALRSPPRDRSNLRAWLSAAVRNAARSLSRSDTRRSAREAALPPRGPAPAAAELVERAHLHRDLVEQVLALEEPQRSLVLAHWFEEQSLAEVARRLGLTERVARARLDQAHAQLRQRLDQSTGGRAVWSLAFLKWTQPQLAVAGAGTALTLGGLAVGSKLAVASVAVVLAAGVGWYLWPQSAPSTPVASSLATPESQVAKPEAGSSELAQGATVSSRETIETYEPAKAATPPGSEKRWIVRGHVDGAPVGTVGQTALTALFIGKYNVLDKATTLAASDGTFEMDLSSVVASWLRNAEPSELVVSADHPKCLRVEARQPFTKTGEFRCDFKLESAAVATGRIVVPPDWSPVQERGWDQVRPRVALFDFAAGPSNWDNGLDHVTCDADGRWTLKANRSGSFTLAACCGGLRPTTLPVTLVLGQRTEVEPLTLARGESISGTIRRGGRPVGAGTRVFANAKTRGRNTLVIPSSDGQPYNLSRTDSSIDYVGVYTITLADGNYRIDGLAPIEYELTVSSSPGTRMGLGGRSRAERTVRATQTGVDLDGVPPTLDLAVTVNGRAPTRAELEGVILDLVPASDQSSAGTIELTGSETGYGKIEVIAGVGYELRLRAGRYAPLVVPLGTFDAGEERTLPLDLKFQDQGSTLVVRFVTARPENLHSAQFGFLDPSDARAENIHWLNVERSEAGTFVLRDRPPGTYRVRIRPYDMFDTSTAICYVPTEIEVVLSPKATLEREVQLELGSRLRMSAKDALGAYVQAAVELRDAGGRTIPTEFYCITAGTNYGCGWYLCQQGPNDHPPLPAGHYEITLKAEGHRDEVVPVDLVAGETKTLDVHLKPR